MAELMERGLKSGLVFGKNFVSTTLQLYHGNVSITPEPTPLGFCLDIEQLRNIVTYIKVKNISRFEIAS